MVMWKILGLKTWGLIISIVVIVVNSDYASDQLPYFKKKTSGPMSVMTTTNGQRVEVKDTVSLNSSVSLLRNNWFMDSIIAFVQERIPERVVHAKGAGAFGYFEVTHNLTDICKAKLFSEVGKKTPVVVRFSHSSLVKGEADSFTDSRGFSIKFYTEEGNFDIAGFNVPVFMTKEPLLVESILRAIKRNPVTDLKDRTAIWDLMTLRPEIVFFFMQIFSDNGYPVSFRHMPGFGIHTYQVANKLGESYFIRFNIMPDAGIKNYLFEDLYNLFATNPDYLTQDLYDTIAKGEAPSWTVSVQVLSAEDVKKADFDVFDVTKILPEAKYPSRPVGKLVLNRNPTNYFADVEQIAFCPCNLVPGILGAPDKIFEARILAYKEAHAHRLGSNPNKIKVNCPFSKVYSYNRDGNSPIGENGGDSPNYYPNTYHGPVPYVDEENTPELINIVQRDDSHNFKQVTEWYEAMSKEQRNRLVKNIVVFSLSYVNKELQKRGVQLGTAVHPEFGYKLSLALAGKPLK